MLRIGVKYCGGCNPSFERVEMLERIKFRFKDQFLFSRYDENEFEAILLINGCQRACAADDLHPKAPYSYSITGEHDFEKVIVWFTSLKKKGEF